MSKMSLRPMQFTTMFAVAIVLSLTAVIAMSAAAQSRSAQGDSILYDPAGGAVIFPRVSVIQWGDVSVARFDSTTGAVHRFSGQLHQPPTKAEWVLEVPPVRERTSGMLRFQQPEGVHAIDAPFLVDVVTGDTWILRSRDVRPRWEKVEFAPR